MKRFGNVALILITFSFLATSAWASNNSAGSVGSLREQVVAQERAGLESLKTEDRAPFNASLAEDAVFVDAHGPATKSEVVEHTAAFRLHDFAMSDVRFVPLGKESGLVVYTLTESGESHGHAFSAKVYVSAAWQKRNGTWICLFSQETGAK